VDAYTHLKSARKSAGRSTAEAAAFLRVSEDMIYRFESGRSSPSLPQLSLMAECYGMQIGDMFPTSQPRSRELAPLLMALEDFEPEERQPVIDKLVRDLSFASMLLKTRVARHENREPLATNHRPRPYNGSDSAMSPESLLNLTGGNPGARSDESSPNHPSSRSDKRRTR
jgi:transcriptional regulator with XRE-family HTH domain